MCFMLYVGTNKPIPRKSWQKEAPGIYVQSLIEYDAAIRQYFKGPEVQQIGSTSGCGCDFPHVIYQNGGWSFFEGEDVDQEQAASDRYNREALVALLQATGENIVELYGVWAGNYDIEPKIREDISVAMILDPGFRFKEQGFYRVDL